MASKAIIYLPYLSTCAYISTVRKPVLDSEVHLANSKMCLNRNRYVLIKEAWPNARSCNRSQTSTR